MNIILSNPTWAYIYSIQPDTSHFSITLWVVGLLCTELFYWTFDWFQSNSIEKVTHSPILIISTNFTEVLGWLRHHCWMADSLSVIGWSRYRFFASDACKWERRATSCKLSMSISQDNTDMFILTLLQGGGNTIMVIDMAMTPELIIPISIGNWHSQLINSWLTGEQTFTLNPASVLIFSSATLGLSSLEKWRGWRWGILKGNEYSYALRIITWYDSMSIQ